MSVERCKTQIRDYLKKEGIKLQESDIDQVARQMEARLRSRPSPAEFLAGMYQEIDTVRGARLAALRAGRLIDLSTSEAVVRPVVENPKLNLAENLRNHYEGGGINPNVGGNKDPVGIADFYKSEFDRHYHNQLTSEQRYIMEQGLLDKDVSNVVAALSSGRDLPSVSKEALELGKILHSSNEYRWSKLKSMNPLMGKSDDFVTTRTWDPLKLFGDGSKEAKTKWVNYMMDNYGEKSFEGMTPLEKQQQFESDYQEIINGTYNPSAGGTRGAMAKPRTYVANSWEADYESNRLWGAGTLYQATMEANTTAGRQLAKLRKFTNDPEAQFDYLYKRHVEVAKERGDAKALAQLEKDYKYIKNSSRATALGEANTPARGYWPKTLDTAMKAAHIGVTGSSVLATAPDLAISAATTKNSFGQNIFEAYTNVIDQYSKHLNPTEQKAFMEFLGLYARTQIATAMRDQGLGATPTAGIAGRIFHAVDWAARGWSKVTGMEFQVNRERMANGAVVGKLLDKVVDLPYEKLNEWQKQSFPRYGLTPEKWEIYKYARGKFPGEDGTFITPGTVMSLPDEIIENYLLKAGTTGQVLYHGTGPDFSGFSEKFKSFGELGKGVYFTPDRAVANQYGKNVITRLLSKDAKVLDLRTPEGQAIQAEIVAQAGTAPNKKSYWGDMSSDEVTASLRARGYDAATYIHPGAGKGAPDTIELAVFNLAKIAEPPKITPEILNRTRMDLAEPIAAIIYDHAQIGSSTPGTRQRAFFYRGHDANDGVGQALRLVWQLKQSSMASADALRRVMASGGASQSNYAGMAQMAVGMLALTTMAYWTKQALTKGVTPEDPRSVKFAADMIARSGVGMVAGDIALDSLHRNGLDQRALAMFEGLAGPTLSKTIELGALGAESIQGKKVPLGKLSRFAFDNLTGAVQNHLLTGPVFNYYFSNGIREHLEPGYIGRTVQRVNQTPGLFEPRQQQFILDPRTSPRW